MWYDDSKPLEGIFPKYIEWNDRNISQAKDFKNQAWLVANYTITEIALNGVRFDLSPRIFTNASEFCPVISHKIEKVIDEKSENKFSKHWEALHLVMLTNGTIDLFGVNNVVRFKIWVTVNNGFVWLNTTVPALLVNTTLPYLRLQNFSPFFESPLEGKGRYMINVTKQREF